jgi:hypothetical protein
MQHAPGYRRGHGDDMPVRPSFEYIESLFNRYNAAFPREPVPMIHWHFGTQAELFALMEEALARGRALSPEDLLAAQGMAPAPPWAVV